MRFEELLRIVCNLGPSRTHSVEADVSCRAATTNGDRQYRSSRHPAMPWLYSRQALSSFRGEIGHNSDPCTSESRKGGGASRDWRAQM
jgi:hypothetical protein